MLAVASSGCRSYVPLTDFLAKIPSPEHVQQKCEAVLRPGLRLNNEETP